jgi:hypothetical protein
MLSQACILSDLEVNRTRGTNDGLATGGSSDGIGGTSSTAGSTASVSREFTKQQLVSDQATVRATASDGASKLYFVGHHSNGTDLFALDTKQAVPEVISLNSIQQADDVAVGAGHVYTMIYPAPVYQSQSLYDASLVRLEIDGATTTLDESALVGTLAADGDYAYWAAFDDIQQHLLVKRVSHAGIDTHVQSVTTQTLTAWPKKIQLGAAGGIIYFGLDLDTSGQLLRFEPGRDNGPSVVPGLSGLSILEFDAVAPGEVYLIVRDQLSIPTLMKLTGSKLATLHVVKASGPGPTLRHLTHADDFVYVLDAPSSIPCAAGEAIYAAARASEEPAQRASDAFCAQALVAITGSVFYFDGSNIEEIDVKQ